MEALMTFETWLVFGHILSAMVWVGGSLMLCLVATRARRSDDPNAVAEFTRTLTFLGPRIMLPAVLGTLLFGVWLVLRSSAWGFEQHWVQAGAGLFLLALAVGAVYMSRIGIALQRAATSGAPAAESRRLLDRWIRGYGMLLGILLLAVWDMVFKPGG
jgi:uncharacterized membrane protein